MPFPQQRYDQVFVPEMGGAMENYGCVTWSDSYIYRDPPSYAEREFRGARAAARDGAHVVRRHRHHALVGRPVAQRVLRGVGLRVVGGRVHRVHRHVGRDARHREAGRVRRRLRADHAPDPTGPRRRRDRRGHASTTSPTPRARRSSSSSSPTSARTSSSTALRSYFRKHAWGNTTLDDLIAELASASGRDLSGWVEGWLETSGTDRLTLERQDGGLTLVATPPAAGDRCRTACRSVRTPPAATDSSLLETALRRGGRRPDRVDGGADADLLLVNDEDLTFATVRPDPASLDLLLARGGELPTAVGRTLALTTAWRPAVRRRADRRAVRRLRRGRARPRDRRLRHRAAAGPAGRGGGPLGARVRRATTC